MVLETLNSEFADHTLALYQSAFISQVIRKRNGLFELLPTVASLYICLANFKMCVFVLILE